MSYRSRAIGIDLGTSYSCAAVYKDGRVEFIPNECGRSITPSVVSFDNEQRLIGQAAQNQSAFNPNNTVYAIKGVIGKNMSDQYVQEVIKEWPFKVVGNGHRIMSEVEYKGKKIQLAPEEVSAIVLGRMKKLSEEYLGRQVHEVVITAPAHFNSIQLQATKDAAKIAGLKVLSLISEPVAAVLAYGLDRPKEKNCPIKLLVFDFGWDILKISVIGISDGSIDVLGTSVGTHFGGKHFDLLLTEHFIKKFNTINPTLNIRKCTGSCLKLKAECEVAKKSLSSLLNTNLELQSLFNGRDFQATLTREEFESLCSGLFQNIPLLLSKALANFKMTRNDVNEVIMVGGSSRIPKVQEVVQGFFSTGTNINKHLSPDLTIAHGAAIRAENLTQRTNPKALTIRELVLIDTTPFSLGLDSIGGLLYVMIPQGSRLPATRTKRFTTTKDNQSTMRFSILQGNKVNSTKNHFIGQFILKKIKPGKKGSAVVEVTFNLEANGILSVKAENIKSRSSNGLTIVNYLNRLTPVEIEEMRKKADEHLIDDYQIKDKLKSMNELENYLYTVQALAEEDRYTRSEKRILGQAFKAKLNWLDQNRNSASQYDFVRNLISARNMCASIIAD